MMKRFALGIVVGFGKLAVNLSTGEWAFQTLAMQLFSALAITPFNGPMTVAVSLPLGAIMF